MQETCDKGPCSNITSFRPIATDTNDFPKLRGKGCIYIDKAFAQIREKGYAEPYRADGRAIWLTGLSFDSNTRRLVEYYAVQYNGAARA